MFTVSLHKLLFTFNCRVTAHDITKMAGLSRQVDGWVHFGEDSINQTGNGVSRPDVQVVLPPPPRKGMSPSPEVTSTQPDALYSSYIPPILPSIEQSELHDVERVQRILSAGTNGPAVLPDLQSPEVTSSGVHIGT